MALQLYRTVCISSKAAHTTHTDIPGQQ